jgi:hypothetical protein
VATEYKKDPPTRHVRFDTAQTTPRNGPVLVSALFSAFVSVFGPFRSRFHCIIAIMSAKIYVGSVVRACCSLFRLRVASSRFL